MENKSLIDDLLRLSWLAIAEMRSENGYGETKETIGRWFGGSACNLCGYMAPEGWAPGLQRDHCHSTQFFRGFLCQSCNAREGQNRSIAFVAWRLEAPHLQPGRRSYYKATSSIEKFKKPVALLNEAPMVEILTIEQILGYR